MEKDTWNNHHESTENNSPSKILLEALHYIQNKEKALDLGSGALVDTKFLLDEGFEVTSVDNSVASLKLAQKIEDSKFTFIQSSFDQFNFGLEIFDVINAQSSLPFNKPETFKLMFEKLKNSLKHQGIFVGQFFGQNDEWKDYRSYMTFHSKEQVEELLQEMSIIKLEEIENDHLSAIGNMKHWHVFNVITKKI